MVKIPDSNDLGVRNPRAVRGQPDYPAGSPVGAALQQLGGAVAQAGSNWAREGAQNAEQDRVKAEKTQALGIQTRLLQFEDEWSKASITRAEQANPGATGYTQAIQGDYFKAAKQFLTTVPEELRPVVDQQLFQLESRLTSSASKFEREEADRYAKNQVADGQNVLLNRQAANPDEWQGVEQEGETLIRSRPGASPVEADEETRAWRQRRALQLFQTRQAQGEAIARGGLGVAAPEGGAAGAAGAVGLLRKFEGFRTGTYWDVNAHRLGYGSDTITKADGSVVAVQKGDTVSREDAERDLARRARDFERTAADQVGADNWSKLPGNARAALTSVAYNYGRLPSSVVTAVVSGDVNRVADAVEGLRGHNGGVNAKRRAEEAAVIRGQEIGGVDYSILSDPAPEYAALPFEARMQLYEQSLADEKKKQNEAAAETRFSIGVAETNAPAAFQQTGSYEGAMPSLEQYVVAYGTQEGAQRFEQFTASVDTGKQIFEMQAAPAAEIAATVQAAQPVSSGDNAALEQKRYETLVAARDAVLKAREADPAGYVTRTFPAVSAAFEQAQTSGDYGTAIRMSVEAQQQLGIQNVRPLAKPVVAAAVGAFKDVNLPETDRVSALMGPIMAVSDAGMQKAILDQMIEGDLPEIAEGAVEAMVRGDDAAAKRLFTAAMVDISKLPGQAPNTPKEIDERIQNTLLDEGQIGDIYYGLSDGTAENFERAQRDSKLLNNAVNLRLRNGETLDAAVAGAAKDLFGDVKTITGDRAQILAPADADERSYLEGLDGLMPKVEAAVSEAMTIPADAPTADGTRAVMEATSRNYVSSVLAEGYFRNMGKGFAFIDPFTGGAIAGPDGAPLIFTDEDVMGARRNAPAPILPSDNPRTMNDNVQDEMQMQEDRVRKMYEDAQ